MPPGRPGPVTPTATYRLQLRQGVDLRAARSAVRYLRELGVSHLYLSPPFAATDGSAHGYDVTDPNAIDPTLGSEEDLRALAADLRAEGLGLLLDVVPNHMAASPRNPAWADVLRRGRSSRHARTFDVDLRSAGDRVVLPVLMAPLDREVADGSFAVDPQAAVVVYRDGLPLPLSAESAERLRRDGPPKGPEAIRAMLDEQHFRLVEWRDLAGRRNYRRFFDVTDLAGVRQEDRGVFARTHALVGRWVREGVVDGLRIDHVDGLRDPLGYLERLRGLGVTWLVVEKILAPEEVLPAEWPVDGTTGYEAANDLNDVLVDPRGWDRLGRLAASFRGGAQEPYEQTRARARRLVLDGLFAGEVEALARVLERFARAVGAEAAAGALRTAIVETTAELDVYRTYVREGVASAADRRRIAAAVRRARSGIEPGGRRALEVLRRALVVEAADPRARRLAIELVERWQQLTGPVAAKGEEDTALYRDVRLVSRNEVGADPGRPPRSVEEVHRRVAARGRRWPASLVATSTHDTKRGEDVRARIDVLSEMPGAWGAAVRRWSDLNAPLRGRVGDREAPSPAEELLLYQTLVGTWPLEGGPGNAFVRRIERYLEKAVREAKVSSSWLEPDAAYERALLRFARRALRSGPFVEELEAFAGRVAYHGALNGLAQVVLRSIVPGVPDLYQGSEGWNLSLVDPDNRGPVDAERLARRLRSVNRAPDPVAMLGRWRDGDVKRFVTSRALRLRRDRPDLFAGGAYVPVAATGRHAPSVVAAARRRGGAWALAVVPRLTTRLVGPDRWPVGPNVWGRTALALPRGAPSSWRDALTGDEVGTARSGGIVPVASALRRFPVALLVADRRDPALAT